MLYCRPLKGDFCVRSDDVSSISFAGVPQTLFHLPLRSHDLKDHVFTNPKIGILINETCNSGFFYILFVRF